MDKEYFADKENNASVFDWFMNGGNVLDWVSIFADYILNNKSACAFEYNKEKDEFNIVVNFSNNTALHFNHNKYGVRVKYFVGGEYQWAVGGEDYYTNNIITLINLCFDLLNNRYSWHDWTKFILKDGISWTYNLE